MLQRVDHCCALAECVLLVLACQQCGSAAVLGLGPGLHTTGWPVETQPTLQQHHNNTTHSDNPAAAIDALLVTPRGTLCPLLAILLVLLLFSGQGSGLGAVWTTTLPAH